MFLFKPSQISSLVRPDRLILALSLILSHMFVDDSWVTNRRAFAAPTPVSSAQETMTRGSEQVALGHELLASSSRYIQIGSQLIRRSNRLQFLARQPAAPSELKTIALDIAQRASELRTEGARLRTAGNDLIQVGTEVMRLGFRSRAGLKTEEVRPITLNQKNPENKNPTVFAHNSTFRTIKSSRQEAKDVQNRSSQPKDNSFGQRLQGQSIPGNLDLNPLIVSTNNRYFAYIRVENDTSVALNQIHRWILTLTTTDGTPVKGAKIHVDGTMPGHVHGMPTRPRVLKETKPGHYVVGGMKFQMAGWWVMTFTVDKDTPQEDRIVSNILL